MEGSRRKRNASRDELSERVEKTADAFEGLGSSLERELSNADEISDSDSFIRAYGVKTHNLQNVDVEIPRNRVVAITGPSGGGKSSFAFDTLFVEGRRQYMECLPTYSRQFLRRSTRPDVERVSGLQPTIAFDQRACEPNPRSSVATITEIFDLLRVLFARIGEAHCENCGRSIYRSSIDEMLRVILRLPKDVRFMLLAPVVRNEKGNCDEALKKLRKSGFTRLRVDGNVVEIDDAGELDPEKKHNIEAIVDRLILRDGIESRLLESLKETLRLGDGFVRCLYEKERQKTEQGSIRSVWKELYFSAKYSCPKCGIAFDELEPRDFSFNSPRGACPACRGLGKLEEFNADSLIRDASLTLGAGALAVEKGLSVASQKNLAEFIGNFRVFAPEICATPLCKWTESDKRLFFYGTREDARERDGSEPETAFDNERGFIGLTNFLSRVYDETKSDREREYLSGFRGLAICRECGGEKLRSEARSVTVDGKSLSQVLEMSVIEALDWFKRLTFDDLKRDVAKPLVERIISRLETASRLRLGYLSLDRSADSLSGGELQRVRLSTVIGSSLSGACYILDEPSSGLHPRDMERLLEVVNSLREKGNTVVWVEHNEKLIRNSDWLIEFGPGAGELGGRVVATGTPEDVSKNEASPTGLYLSGKKAVSVPPKRRKIVKTRSISLEGVCANNLKNVSVSFPLGTFICVTGVSGSGKSSLIIDSLVPALRRRLRGSSRATSNEPDLPIKSVRGANRIDKVVLVDQDPLGRSSRSSPATFSGLFDEIRKIFASTLDARRRGFKAGRFSFNIAGGRCETCQGLGVRKIESTIFPDMLASCPDCEGRRFNKATLDVKFQGKSIADVLEMSFNEANDFFANRPSVLRYIESFIRVGLGYLQLGRSVATLSGGEAQRVKLATELSATETGNSLFVFDEPTRGLHCQDVSNLLDVLNDLVDSGNTVIVVEHSLDVMKSADWIIDLGPEGGVDGGRVLATGVPEEFAKLEDNETAFYLREALERR